MQKLSGVNLMVKTKMYPKSIAFDEEAEVALRYIEAWMLINTGVRVSASAIVRHLVVDHYKELKELDKDDQISDSQPVEQGD